MDLSKIIIICVLYIILGGDYVLSLPTFGGDHVHIKVYLSPKHSTPIDISKFQHQHVSPKIIHHYRHYQRPFEKLPSKEIVPVLENFYLSELDKFQRPDNLHRYKQEPKAIEETFLVETQLTNPKSKGDIGIIQQPHHEENAKNSVETIRLVESIQNHDGDYKFQHQKNIDHHIATVKVVGESSFHQYQNGKHMEEVIKIVEAPKFITTSKNRVHEPQVTEVVDEEPESPLSKNIHSHNYDIQYDYVSPEKIQTFNFQAVPIYQDIPHARRPAPVSAVFIEDDVKYKPHRGSHLYLPQETQNIKQIYMTSADEEQGTLKYITAYQKHLPSSETPQSFNRPQMNYLQQSSEIIVANKNDECSHNQENPTAAETYTGFDSYSAAHVQGLGSGAYINHKLF